MQKADAGSVVTKRFGLCCKTRDIADCVVATETLRSRMEVTKLIMNDVLRRYPRLLSP
jgi:hypothetical protein